MYLPVPLFPVWIHVKIAMVLCQAENGLVFSANVSTYLKLKCLVLLFLFTLLALVTSIVISRWGKKLALVSEMARYYLDLDLISS